MASSICLADGFRHENLRQKEKRKKLSSTCPRGWGHSKGCSGLRWLGWGGGRREGANPLAKNEIWKFWNFLESGLSGPRMVSLCTLFEWLHYDTVSISMSPCNGELWVQKYGHICWEKRAQSSLPLKPQIGQYIAIHAMLTARFSKTSRVFPVLAVANTGSRVGLQNKIGHPAGCMFQCCVPAEYIISSKTCAIVFLGLRSKIVDRIWVVI